MCNQSLKDLTLPPETLIVLLKRAGENIIPDGNTVLQEKDVLILSATTPDQVEGLRLLKSRLQRRVNMQVAFVGDKKESRMNWSFMIQRGEQIYYSEWKCATGSRRSACDQSFCKLRTLHRRTKIRRHEGAVFLCNLENVNCIAYLILVSSFGLLAEEFL